MGNIDLPNNLIDVVRYIVSEELRYYKFYAGKVKKRSTQYKGVIYLYAIQFAGNKENDESKWLIAKPANTSRDALIPEVDEWVYFSFANGNANNPIYFGSAYEYHEYIKPNQNVVLFEYSDTNKDAFIYYDKEKSKLIIETGSDTLEKSVLGETLVDKIKELIDLIAGFKVMTPVGMSGTISSLPDQVASIESYKAAFDEILSNNLELN